MDTDSVGTEVTVRLSDGRVARLTKPDPARERRTDLLALQVGLRRGGRFDPLEMAKLRVLCAIVAIDGVSLPWPPMPAQRAKVRAYIASFTFEDYNALALAYSAIYPGGLVPLVQTARHR